MEYSVNYLLVSQAGTKDEDIWCVGRLRKEEYDDLVNALSGEHISTKQGMLEACIMCQDDLASYISKEEAIQIANDYADDNPVTVYVTVPLL